MFFYVSKILWFFLQPSNAVLFLLIAGVAMAWSRWARAGRAIVLAAGVAMLLGGISPLGHALILPLENRFARTALEEGPPPDGILILGGAQDMSVTAARGSVALNEAGERLVEAALLARRFPNAKVVFTGGSSAIFGDRTSEAEGARILLTGLGISNDRLMLEKRAKNTYQNAQFSKDLIKPDKQARWLLVTSASHMPRAMGSFRAVGFKIEPWPVDYRTRGREDIYRFFPRASEGWRRVDSAVREWAGLAIYRLTGRTSSLFPRPRENQL
jgi:uncharacterized SAM-binding protein YcdF (DUF218 family)